MDMWKIVQKVRPSNEFQSDDFKCFGSTNMLGIKPIRLNNELLESFLGVKGGTVPMEDVLEETLETGAEMFTYMNLCSVMGKLYKDVIKTSSPKQIFLALYAIFKKSTNSDKKVAEMIWTFYTHKLNLTSYQKIECITKENDSLNNEKCKKFNLMYQGAQIFYFMFKIV